MVNQSAGPIPLPVDHISTLHRFELIAGVVGGGSRGECIHPTKQFKMSVRVSNV